MRFSLLFIFLMGLIFTFLVPPFQKPDEYSHFLKAETIAQGIFYCSKSKNNRVLILDQYKKLITDKNLHQVVANKYKTLDTAIYVNALRQPFRNAKTQINIDAICNFPPLPYLFYSLPLFLASFLKLNAYVSFFIGRFGGFLLFYFWILYLFKKTPKPFNLFLLYLFLLPMTIHQLTTYSYDGLTILVAASIFSLFVNLVKKKKITSKDLFFISTLFITLFFSKQGGYELLTLIFFIIPLKRIGRNFKEYFLRVTPFFLAVFFTFLLSRISVYKTVAFTSFPSYVNPPLQLNFILSHPEVFILMFVKTTWHSFIFYFQSLIGVFGWLEYGLSYSTYFLYLLGFLYLVYTSFLSSPHKLNTKNQILLIFILSFSYFYILVIDYLFWNPVGSAIADGVQGRYFLPFVPYLIYLLVDLKEKIIKFKIKTSLNFTRTTGLIILACIYLYIILDTIYHVTIRFYKI